MAGRLPKRGLDYAGWPVSIFDNDTRMDKLLDAQGWDGFGVYFYLCQRIYGGEGYFYRWGYDDCASTARKMGGGIGSGTVRETVDYCLQIGLFDKGLFDRWGVLTNRDVQSRYCSAIRDRDVKQVVAEYWLLQKSEECKGLLKLPLNPVFPSGNPESPSGNINFPSGNEHFQPQSKVKKSKVNKNTSYAQEKEEENDVATDGSRVVSRFLLADNTEYYVTESMALAYASAYPDADIIAELKRISVWCSDNKEKRKTRKGARRFLNGWMLRAQEKAEGREVRPREEKKNRFRNFRERDYDFGALEQALINRPSMGGEEDGNDGRADGVI